VPLKSGPDERVVASARAALTRLAIASRRIGGEHHSRPRRGELPLDDDRDVHARLIERLRAR
jgi:hypothetical protein